MKSAIIFAILGSLLGSTLFADKPLNVLLITVDDMNCDSVGVFGSKVPDTSPNIDQLASEGMRFMHAHVQVANCMPSRNVMQSGLYPINNGIQGFYYNEEPDYPILPGILQENGWFVGIKSKETHTPPFSPYPWDAILKSKKHKGKGNKDAFYDETMQGIQAAEAAGKPFYLIMNISDPHKPFYGMNKKNHIVEDKIKPTKIFTEDDIVVPGFLPDTPVVRKEVAHYYSSVRRADDAVGAILQALEDSEQEENTVVFFLSDHGMALPFAKTTVYHHGTHTPWIVRWPNAVKPGSIDSEHMISAVDLAPTLLDILGVDNPSAMDGRSFEPLLKGQQQNGREWIIKEYNESSTGARNPMRSVQTRQFCYIYNPWSDGERTFKTATIGTLTHKEMRRLAKSDPLAEERLNMFKHRVVEELYDVTEDPDSLNNLAEDPAYEGVIAAMRQKLKEWMQEHEDPLLAAFEQRDDPTVAAAYMERVQKESDQRKREGKIAAWKNSKN